MSSTTQLSLQPEQPAPANRSLSTPSVLESITKMATLLGIGSYAIGYLIVVINDSAHGFLETSLIRPRAITAGAVFILLTVLPSSLTQDAFFNKVSETESRLQELTRWLLGLVDYIAASLGVGLLIFIILFKYDFGTGPIASGRMYGFLALIWAIAANGILRLATPKFYRIRPAAWIIFGVVCLGGLFVGAYTLRGFTVMKCWAWLFAVSIPVNVFLSDRKRGIKLQFKVPVLAAMLLAVVSFYSVYLYPLMKATWGGGAPVPTVMYLSRDSPIHTNQRVKAALLEASDSGFYVIFDGDEKATYVPRASVTAMEFTPSPNK